MQHCKAVVPQWQWSDCNAVMQCWYKLALVELKEFYCVFKNMSMNCLFCVSLVLTIVHSKCIMFCMDRLSNTLHFMRQAHSLLASFIHHDMWNDQVEWVTCRQYSILTFQYESLVRFMLHFIQNPISIRHLVAKICINIKYAVTLAVLFEHHTPPVEDLRNN